ncbi:4-diphosphocytidyl-2-C-methyl-D-erythritol kinase [Aureimonas sp. SA4125]|uniref:4-(cytidine 5'-diphospho)-2-C-methyl-D-erythritol kinase n=1 Tax=Aureimonas sp. SA4125 TaxID=2826993 RepID=UPI001CC3E393|nr:4-(cytidine 5'-diphospho)-2-C-methyl-D-erythritol kinase [Aureimonas sp. SA4125]BDA83054.1 4-diphosphocytidyl-2-C-methyl-D-erythritol kinase [Aureimonas sp. SA4125]
MTGARGSVPVARPEWREPAPAKVNLALHVTGQRADGYHTLSSLVAFTEMGDSLTASPSTEDRLTLSGPFAAALGAGPVEGNILVKALCAARSVLSGGGSELPPLALALDKRLPVASGIGGGSADAAALLRIVAQMFPARAAALREAALTLGADVPMCFDGVPAQVEGLGEIAAPLARFPSVACLLVNPGMEVSTPAVFRQLASRSNPPMPSIPSAGFASLTDLVGYLSDTRNDLAAPAGLLAPEIARLEASLRQAGAAFARMSGSGATVFALFDSPAAANDAARTLARHYPSYWIFPTRLMPSPHRQPLDRTN